MSPCLLFTKNSPNSLNLTPDKSTIPKQNTLLMHCLFTHSTVTTQLFRFFLHIVLTFIAAVQMFAGTWQQGTVEVFIPLTCNSSRPTFLFVGLMFLLSKSFIIPEILYRKIYLLFLLDFSFLI